VDFWAMSRSIHWSRQQNTVVQKLLKRARHGTRVIFVPGNHDEVLREYVGTSFGDIELVQETVHVAADGKRYAVLHGDEFDQVTRHHRWVAVLGDVAYNLLVRLNTWLSLVRRTLGISGYWSLAGLRQTQSKKCRRVYLRFRRFGHARNTRSRARWRDLRPHSQRSHTRHQWPDLYQLRETGSTVARPSSSTWTGAWNLSSG
jgi:UDP-2,3-diacylglucosamine pyrophosphatase LpxH